MKTRARASTLSPIDPSWRIGIVVSSHYKEEVDALVEGAIDVLVGAGISAQRVMRYDAPGSFEIPVIGAALAEEEKVDGLIGLGIIIEGETAHARLLAESVAHGIMDVQTRFLIPFAFEVLYVDSIEQARARACVDHNKGNEAAQAVLHSLAQLRSIRC